MSRRKKRRSSNGGSGTVVQRWGGSMLIVFGCIAMLVCLIMFGIAIQQLDTQITNATTYTEMVSLTEVMGISGLIIFILFMALGLGSLAGGAYVNIKSRASGSWTDIVMLAIIGGVTLVIALIMNGTLVTQLHTTIGTVNSTTNYATYFKPVQTIMTVFGLVIFVSILMSGIAQIGFAVWGGYQRVRNAF